MVKRHEGKWQTWWQELEADCPCPLLAQNKENEPQ